MKTLRNFLALALLLVSVSCSKDDDGLSDSPEKLKLENELHTETGRGDS